MNYRTSRGVALVLLLLPALVVAIGLVFYLHHTGKLDLSFLRKWQVETGNVVRQATSESDPKTEKTLSVDLEDLSGGLGESQVVERYRDAQLSCFSVRDPLGDYACSTPVVLFNNVPARSAAFYFQRDRLTSLRVTFPIEQHAELTSRITGKYGPAKKLGLTDPASGRPLQGWKIPSGILGINDSVPGEREAVMLWVTSRAVLSSSRQ